MYKSILFLNILALLVPTESADNLFHSFTVLCENENVLIYCLHCFFANVTPSPLVLLASLTVKKYLYPADVQCEYNTYWQNPELVCYRTHKE